MSTKQQRRFCKVTYKLKDASKILKELPLVREGVERANGDTKWVKVGP